MIKSKKAILVVSFGTSHQDTRERTIDKIEADIQTANQEYTVYRAWTSKMVICKLAKQGGIEVKTVKEAMEEIISDKIEELIVQPTHVINGIENDMMIKEVLSYKENLASIKFGAPLLTSDADYKSVVKILMAAFSDLKKEEVLVLMGHGTTHYANAAYAALDYTLKEMGYHNAFVATVEAYPKLDDILHLIKEYNPKKVILTPLMIVAGDHAKNDMAGMKAESWKCRMGEAGYKVECVVKGLGEYEEIRELLLGHLREAMD